MLKRCTDEVPTREIRIKVSMIYSIQATGFSNNNLSLPIKLVECKSTLFSFKGRVIKNQSPMKTVIAVAQMNPTSRYFFVVCKFQFYRIQIHFHSYLKDFASGRPGILSTSSRTNAIGQRLRLSAKVER